MCSHISPGTKSPLWWFGINFLSKKPFMTRIQLLNMTSQIPTLQRISERVEDRLLQRGLTKSDLSLRGISALITPR